MKKFWKITLAAILFLLLVGPFLIPVPPLDGTQPARTFADPDGQFIEINGIDVHYKKTGSGELVFILLHGFGASTFSWREVMTPLSDYGTVIAYDRPAFGLTERPLNWDGESPYSQESNMALLLGLMDAMDIEEAVLVGNSAGGTLATAFTLVHPERVKALIEVDAALYFTMPDSPLLSWLLETPQMDRIGPLVARILGRSRGEKFLENAFHDPALLEANPEIIEGYRKPLMIENWDKALWMHTQASQAPELADRLDQITVPTLVITGDDDRIVPTKSSVRLAEDIPGAQLAIFQNCGHMPQEECPAAFIEAVENFIHILK